MATTVTLSVVTPRRPLLETEATQVRLPGVEGELGALPEHTPLLTALGVGVLTYFRDGREHHLAIRRGFAEVLANRVTVLAEVAERRDEIDADAARRDLEAGREELKTATADNLDQVSTRVRMAEARLAVVATDGD